MVASAMAVNSFRAHQEPVAESSRGSLCERLLGSVCEIYPADWVDRDLRDYVWFDARRFVGEPYLVYDFAHTRRQTFLNHLVKSSVLGTQYAVPDPETAYAINGHVARFMNVLLLGMLAFLALAVRLLDRARVQRYSVVLLAAVLFVAMAATSGLLIPAPHHLDFRHVFPVLPLVALVYASAVRVQRPAFAYAGYALGGAFLALSIFYFWPKYEWAVRLTAHTVRTDLAAYATPVRSATSWNKPSNLIIEGRNTVELGVSPPRAVAEVDISLDNNDTYELVLVGATGTRTLSLGPDRDAQGLARYIQKIEPPLEQVGAIRLRVLRGDRIYAMGHLILR
jgi:hypothetical protein